MSEAVAEPKCVTAYCHPWSLRAGEAVTLKASSHQPCEASISIVRIFCGDRTSSGPGYREDVVDCGAIPQVALSHQTLDPGSYGTVDLHGLAARKVVELQFELFATAPGEDQIVAAIHGRALGLRIELHGGLLHVLCGENRVITLPVEIAERRWYAVCVRLDMEARVISGSVSTSPSRSPGRDFVETPLHAVEAEVAVEGGELEMLVFGGTAAGGAFDGRIAAPRLTLDEVELWWDFALSIGKRELVDGSEYRRDGELHQLPATGVTGPSWDGTQQRWTDDPGQWNAIHFHKDDLYDACWPTTAVVTMPASTPSGIYAFRIVTEQGEDRVPFFLRPAVGSPTNDVALLMPTATYLAYANHRMLFEGADFIQKRTWLSPEHDYVRRHPELGRSLYEKHPDGSGVMFTSRRRPVLNLRPSADRWNFTPDTDIDAFLHHLEVGHDIVTDDDVHSDGGAALAHYRVIVTGSHPEYWSTRMLDALEQWQRDGGRLLYLGGNGFYWRVAFSDAWPDAMELRRAEDGVRNWQTESGENYHAFTGEYGGLWRRLGRAPNELVGVGFAAQGFGKASHFDINPASRSSRASWIWSGVNDDEGRIGTSGLGGGAAGQELDRYDTKLGSPRHAVVLASASTFGPDMVRAKEEFEGTVQYPSPDPFVRADVVFYETPNGGAVFSVGSISWFGALARNGYDNDIAQMTANVIHRFIDPEPLNTPDD